MIYKNKKSRTAIPGYTLIPDGDCHKIRKISLTSERLKTDPAFHITRLHTEEFTRATRFGKLIRSALLPGTGIKNKAAPLTGVLINALQADTNTTLGMRNFDTADCTGLTGFECNPEATFRDSCSLDIGIELLPTEGLTVCYIPALVPANVFTAPTGITHARITITTVIIDTAENTCDKYGGKSNLLPLKEISVNGLSQVTAWQAKKNNLVIVALGIRWYQIGKTENKIITSPLAGALSIRQVQRIVS